MIVSYLDPSQAETSLPFIAANPDTSLTRGWGVEWLTGDGPLLSPGERVEITVNLVDLGTLLRTNTRFSIQVRPSLGAVLTIDRRTRAELTRVTDLQ